MQMNLTRVLAKSAQHIFSVVAKKVKSCVIVWAKYQQTRYLATVTRRLSTLLICSSGLAF